MKLEIDERVICKRAKYFIGCILLRYTALNVQVYVNLKLLLNRHIYRQLKMKISVDATSESVKSEYSKFKSCKYNANDGPIIEFI